MAIRMAGLPDVDFGSVAEADFKAQCAAALADLIGAVSTAAATGAVTNTDLGMAYIKQLVTELQALVATVGTPLTAANIQTEATDALRDVFGGAATNYSRLAIKSPASVATGTLFTYTGTITIVNICGFIPATGLDGTSTLRLGFVADALAEVFLCAASANTQWGVGTFLNITGTAADAMGGDTTVPGRPTMATPWTIGCTTSGIIRLTAGTARAGVINWMVKWMPETTGATLVAA